LQDAFDAGRTKGALVGTDERFAVGPELCTALFAPTAHLKCHIRNTDDLLAPSNVKRLSCAAVPWYSQMQFYYDGRRQLQPPVRRHACLERTAPPGELLPPARR
jgi:hypothetical protein